MVEAATHALSNRELGLFFTRIKRKRGTKIARVALAHRLQVPGSEGVDQGRLLDDRTSGDVDEDGPGLGPGEILGTQRFCETAPKARIALRGHPRPPGARPW